MPIADDDEGTIVEDAPLCPRCLQRPDPAYRAALVGACVLQILVMAAIPLIISLLVQVGPNCFRSEPGVLGLVLTGLILGTSALYGFAACATEARR